MKGAAVLALVVAGSVAGAWLLPEFHVTQLVYVGLNVLVCLGLVLLTGICGLTSFGQAAFVGMAAYATTIVTVKFGLSPWLGLAAAIFVTGLAAAILGALTLRLSGHYLPLGTIAWGVALYLVFGNIDYIGGHTGLSGIPPVGIGDLQLTSPRHMLPLVASFAAFAAWTCRNLLSSRAGRAMRAINGHAAMAEAMGVNTTRYKALVFIYAACLAGISGWLYAHFQRFVSPTPFGLHAGVDYLFMVVIGGANSIAGAVLGAGLVTFLQQWLRGVLPAIVGQSGKFEAIVFGSIVVLALRYAPGGVWASLLPLFNAAGRADMPARAAAASDAFARLVPAPVDANVRAAGPLLDVEGVIKTFGGLTAIDGVSFSVMPKEIVALIGPNGAGKSTMFNVISGLLRPSEGVVRFLGEQVSGKRSRAIAMQGMGRTFQHVKLLGERSVLENVLLGAHRFGHASWLSNALRLDRAEEARLVARAQAAIELVGLGEFMDAPAGNLALGQQRIVEIARALALEPKILLLDEPAAGLRFNEKQRLAALIEELRAAGMSVLLVDHDMEFVMNLADRIVVMNYGAKIAEGRPQEVQGHAQVREAYLGIAA